MSWLPRAEEVTGSCREARPPVFCQKGEDSVLYGEPETSRFLAAVQRIKKKQRRKAELTRQAKQRVRSVLRKMREC